MADYEIPAGRLLNSALDLQEAKANQERTALLESAAAELALPHGARVKSFRLRDRMWVLEVADPSEADADAQP